MHHPTYRIAHTTAFVTPVVEHWLEPDIAQWVQPRKDRSDDPFHHERTLLPRSYIRIKLRLGFVLMVRLGLELYIGLEYGWLYQQWRNYGGGALGGHDPPHLQHAPPIGPHLTFHCAPFIAMPSSWPYPDEGLPSPFAPPPSPPPKPPLSYATVCQYSGGGPSDVFPTHKAVSAEVSVSV